MPRHLNTESRKDWARKATHLAEEEEIQDPVIQTHVNEDGTTSNYFDKRKLKIAPRSTLQFKVGPPFEFIGDYHSVTEVNTCQTLKFQIIPRIDRGFDFIDEQWVGYKRNYFTLVSSFETPGWELNDYLKSSFQVNMNFGHRSKSFKIKYFAIKIQARNEEDSSKINLVQHTAKRDKGPQFSPATFPLVPSPLPKHQIIREASNVRNTVKMKKYDSTFFFHRNEEELSQYSEDSLLKTYPNDSVQKVARYERVQFASAVNTKKPTQQSRQYRLHVVLGAVINYGDDFPEIFDHESSGGLSEQVLLLDGTREGFVPLQEVRTPALVIRGRSASNYTTCQRVAVRNKSSCISDTERRESSNFPSMSSSLSPSLGITTLTTPSNVKSCRPAKRKSNVIGAATRTSSIYNGQENENENENVIVRKSKRVETLEEIEKSLRMPLAIRSENDENKPDVLVRPTIMSRHNSIDPREIEIKPSPIKRNHCPAHEYNEDFEEENHFATGSLALTATLRSQNLVPFKKRRTSHHSPITRKSIASEEMPSVPNSPSESPLESNASTPDRSKNKRQIRIKLCPQDSNNLCEFSGSDLDSLSLSILGDSSSNYNHVTNIDSIHSEIDAVPRTFTRVIGENSFTNLYLQMERTTQTQENFLTSQQEENLMPVINALPSQMMDVGDFYEELGFYR